MVRFAQNLGIVCLPLSLTRDHGRPVPPGRALRPGRLVRWNEPPSRKAGANRAAAVTVLLTRPYQSDAFWLRLGQSAGTRAIWAWLSLRLLSIASAALPRV